MTTAIPTAPAFRAADAVARIEAASRRVQQPQSAGDLVSLAMGEPDFDTPIVVRQAAIAAINAGRTHYAPLLGDPALRRALAEKLGRIADVDADPDDVLVTQGGTAGLSAAILSVVDPGDRVVIPDPTYSLYADLINMAGGVAVPVPLSDDLHWNLDALAKAVSGARMFVFCNPVNPTGIVHSRTELEALAAMLQGTQTIVLSDEAYADLVFTDAPFTSAIEVTRLRERTIYCQTFSKSYAMTGWRVGYLWGPHDLIQAASRVHNTFNGSLNSVVQDAALAAITAGDQDVAAMRAVYRQRGALMRDCLHEIPGLTVSSPEGAFYQFPRYDIAIPSMELVGLLRGYGVAVRPGAEFGAGGENHLRLSYAASEGTIRTGIRRLGRAFEDLRRSRGMGTSEPTTTATDDE